MTKMNEYSFPQPQYLGSKYLLRDWIKGYIPAETTSFMDVFAGSQTIAFTAKTMNKKVITNDFLYFNSQIGNAIISNKSEILSDKDIEFLFSKTNHSHLMKEQFANLFFSEKDCDMLDNFRHNAEQLSPFKRSLALTVMCRAMTRHTTFGHFAHTKAMEYATNTDRVKRNPSLVQSPESLFLTIVGEYNNCIFDNGKDNECYNEDAIELVRNHQADVGYFDPPYCGSHADYQSFYHVLETFCVYWKDKTFVNGTHRYFPYRKSGFDKKREELKNLDLLFREADKNIPVWLVSYNDRSFPDVETMKNILGKYRHISMQIKPYKNSYGGKGSVKGSSEILFVCE